MKNTGIVYHSTERTPTVLAELAGLLPPLSGEQLAALEADLLQNGCYSPVIVNEELVIVDALSIHPGKAEDPVSDEPHQFLTSGELDVNDLFSTKLQEGACTAHLRGVFTNTGEVEITLLKKNEELASPAFQAELNTLLGALRGDSGPLRDLPSMRAYCEARPQALMRGRQAFYAFRIDTGKYRYYLRFFPQRELHKFFIFCYQTDRLREDLPKPDFHYLNRRRKHQKREERS